MWEVAPSIEECGAVGELASALSNCSLYINCHPCEGEDLGQEEARRIYRAPYSPEPDINRSPYRPEIHLRQDDN